MKECRWGGDDDRFYYEVDSGRIIGRIEKSSMGNYDVFYIDQYANPFCGEYIDTYRARKVIEEARRRTDEFWKRSFEANKVKPVQEDTKPEPMKSWWKIWE